MSPLQKVRRKLEVERHAHATLKAIRKEHQLAAGSDIVPVYLHQDFPDKVPGVSDMLSGGGVKYQYLNAVFPEYPSRCNVAYVVSSWRYHHTYDLLTYLKGKGVKVIWNQNGSFVHHFYGERYANKMNSRMFREMQLADYVFFQSEYAKAATEELMGTYQGPSEILYNSIDSNRFVPANDHSGSPDVIAILMAGSHNDPYRLRLGIETFEQVRNIGDKHYVFKIAGNILPNIRQQIDALIAEKHLVDSVEYLGPYTQEQAVSVYQQGDILLHTKYMDVCPSMVLEAMSCGLPVVYSKTGGTPELVGEYAGMGVLTKESLYKEHLPSAEALAEAVIAVAEQLPVFSEAARRRVVESFDLKSWVVRHAQIFKQVLH